MRSKQMKRRFGFESLETRRMFDGVITSTFQSGTLTLVGDVNANAVLITSTSPETVKVIGLDTTANSIVSPTLINTVSSKTYSNVINIIVDFSGGGTGINTGNDIIYVTGLTITGGLAIKGGDGNNKLTIGDFDNSGNEIDPSNNGFIGDVTIDTGVAITMGGGDNTISADQLAVHGPVGNNLNISAGDGTNTFSFDNTTIGHAAKIVETGSLDLTLDHFQANNLTVNTGIGNDDVELTNSTIAFQININTGFGNDLVDLEHDSAGSLTVALGAGNDQMTVDTMTVLHDSVIGAGIDNDTVDLTNFSSNTLNLELGTGDDTSTLTTVTITKMCTIDGNDGADSITLDHLSANNLMLTGGAAPTPFR